MKFRYPDESKSQFTVPLTFGEVDGIRGRRVLLVHKKTEKNLPRMWCAAVTMCTVTVLGRVNGASHREIHVGRRQRWRTGMQRRKRK